MERAIDKNIVDITGAISRVDFFLLHEEIEKTNLKKWGEKECFLETNEKMDERKKKCKMITNKVINIRLQRNDEASRVEERETRSIVWRRNLGFITILL
jgi:hypothetical protein